MNSRTKLHGAGLVVAVVAMGLALVPFGYDRFYDRVECGSPVTAAFKDPHDAVPPRSPKAGGPQILDPSFGFVCVNRARGRLVGAGGTLLLAGLSVSVGGRIIRGKDATADDGERS